MRGQVADDLGGDVERRVPGHVVEKDRQGRGIRHLPEVVAHDVRFADHSPVIGRVDDDHGVGPAARRFPAQGQRRVQRLAADPGQYRLAGGEAFPGRFDEAYLFPFPQGHGLAVGAEDQNAIQRRFPEAFDVPAEMLPRYLAVVIERRGHRREDSL